MGLPKEKGSRARFVPERALSLGRIAKLYARIGAKELALEAYDVIRDRPKVTLGAQLLCSRFFLARARSLRFGSRKKAPLEKRALSFSVTRRFFVPARAFAALRSRSK